MTITKISKLKNFGIFHDFTWLSDLPDFKRFNLIYGWNGSGKTTISRIFTSCEKNNIEFKQYPINGEFEIITSDDKYISNMNINSSLPIKVFNKDFIDDNISFDPSNPSNPIVYISEEDILSKDELEKLKKKKENLENEYNTANYALNEKIKTKDNFLISIGSKIKENGIDINYNKRKAENKIDEIGIDNFQDKFLKDEIKKNYELRIKGETKKTINTIDGFHIKFIFDGEEITNFDKISSIIQQLLNKKITSVDERLKNDPKLNDWVKQGFDLLKTYGIKDKCLFCEKPLNNDFFNNLSNHFNKDYQDLQDAISSIIEVLKGLKKDEFNTQGYDFYPELSGEVSKLKDSINIEIRLHNQWIESAISALNEKYKNPLSVISNLNIQSYPNTFNNYLDNFNKNIKEHNSQVLNNEQHVKKAKESLELHHLAEAVRNYDYKNILFELSKAEENESSLQNEIKKNNDKILVLEQRNSNVTIALKDINNHLEAFLCTNEIKLKLDDNKKGYILTRNNNPANNLSEGEKTAIAFSYFIVKVKERNFKIEDGIFFIDDPISSLDSNFIFHCFSLIKVYFKDAGQLFVFTHNFELFNFIKYWFNNKDGFYMLENYMLENSNIRSSKIKELEDTLKKFKSEYHYLFVRLYEFTHNTRPVVYDDLYTISNIARRFLEMYLTFKIPSTGDVLSKIKALNIKKEDIKEEEIETVYKLINEYSHASDISLKHPNKAEIQKVVTILLKIVKISDEKHFETIESDFFHQGKKNNAFHSANVFNRYATH
ncbi:MAG: AAA family ATPase [Nitrospirae bacterium]|nr:AAA family ATPase [Nitrospirota bacterium]MBF0541278.1 AAA family ATPase [Nitrospirota bacterium]